MNRKLNIFLNILKVILLIISFSLVVYIIIGTNYRLNNSLFNSILYLAPFVILLFIYVLNFIFKQDRINSNLFYILTSLLVFIVIIFVCIRAICDNGMLLNKVMGYGINFNYFSDFIIFMEIMLYGLIVSNLLFMLNKKSNG